MGRKFLIISDSLHALRNLTELYTTDPLIKKCQTFLTILANNEYEIVFIWVPGHADIPGNDQADHAARSAASDSRIEVNFVKRIEWKIHLQKRIIDRWQQRWSTFSTHLSMIKKSVIPPTFFLELPRQESVKAHRLRIGHTKLTHEHLLMGNEAPLCTYCSLNLSIEHILYECTYLKQERDRSSIKMNVADDLSPHNITNTLNYLKKIRIYDWV